MLSPLTGRLDSLILEFDHCLRALLIPAHPVRAQPLPPEDSEKVDLTDAERRHAAALMRVNHVGEVCAQALYRAQALTTNRADLRAEFQAAAQEESDHLAWTAQRLDELKARPSLINPLWYAGAYGLGLLAGKLGDAASLGFVVETERQVEQHLASHLERLPANDHASRAIVEQMRVDEMRHGQAAQDRGAASLPQLVQAAMRVAARAMTTTAYWI